jgi:hypothetical protein
MQEEKIMSSLKGTEKFVAESLQSYFKKTSVNVSYEDGSDPPDIYLKINGKKVAVEITDIDQNVLKNRKTIDYGYLNFIDNIDKEFGHLISADKKILLSFHHDYAKVSTISKKFKNYLKSLINADKLKIDNSIEDNINDVSFKISILPMPTRGTRKIVGSAMPFGGKVKKSRDINTVFDTISDCHLLGQTFNIVNDRIYDKNIKCKNIEKPIWLALFDNYYNKFTYFDNHEHLEHYKDTFESIEDFGIFEKILVVFENGDVLEFNT